jgi:hypothetical protein
LWLTLIILGVTLSIPNPSSKRLLSIIPLAPYSSHPTPDAPGDSVPALAYYYIWFDPQSWDRAKKDFPLLGRYSSDDSNVMRQHIRWAKHAGIDGFIVSWKSTDKLNYRLSQLVKIAEQENFKLAIIYEGLDFDRNPRPIEQVDHDLTYFVNNYADQPVFDIYRKPLVIWSGTWQYTTAQIDSIVQDKRDRVYILASEKNVEGYERLAKLVDGDAYYWSSVNPETHSTYFGKLKAMSEAIHQNRGLWIAPAAPGYDSQLVGGTTVVDRKNGETLKTEIQAALQSLPDAVGLISWNEFSENSYIEPSQAYGDQYLRLLADIRFAASDP